MVSLIPFERSVSQNIPFFLAKVISKILFLSPEGFVLSKIIFGFFIKNSEFNSVFTNSLMLVPFPLPILTGN